MSDWQKRYQRLLFDRPHPKVLRVTMNRPDKYNATDSIMHTELVNVWRDIDGDDTRQLRDHPGRRRQGILGRRRLRSHRKEHEGLQRAAAHLEGSARHRLQRHQLLQADRQHHARPRRRRRPGRRHPGRRVDRLQEGENHRRPHAARRRRRRSRRDRLAAALRHGQGQVLPAALRGGRRRGGRAHRPGLALRRGRSARSQRRSKSRPSSPRARRPRSASPSTRSTTGCA